MCKLEPIFCLNLNQQSTISTNVTFFYVRINKILSRAQSYFFLLDFQHENVLNLFITLLIHFTIFNISTNKFMTNESYFYLLGFIYVKRYTNHTLSWFKSETVVQRRSVKKVFLEIS